MKYALAFDVGTGSVKAALFDENGTNVAVKTTAYPTFNGIGGIAEQDPDDWWIALTESVKSLAISSDVAKNIVGIGISGHSLGVVPISKDGKLLTHRMPIWSDRRADSQADNFFSSVDYESWYSVTGNGFPRALYPVFKLMWLRENRPELYNLTDKFIGTKDYLNYLLTGNIVTDRSYASGSGVYSLTEHKYIGEYISAARLDEGKLPETVGSSDIIGRLTESAASELGLPCGIPVVGGGVDNACMTLGAGCFCDGEMYASLGSSSQIAVSSSVPLTDKKNRFYVWEHCVAGKYVVSTGVFSSGTAFEWLLSSVFGGNLDYKTADSEAECSPVGGSGVMFCPMLAGGAPTDPSVDMQGGFFGLTLGSTRGDIIRSVFEGIAIELKLAYDALASRQAAPECLLLAGGGAKSDIWRKIYTDVFGLVTVSAPFTRNTGAIGAAALAFNGTGVWHGYEKIHRLYTESGRREFPEPADATLYRQLFENYKRYFEFQASLQREIAGKNKYCGE